MSTEVRLSFEGDVSAGTFVCTAAAGSRDLTQIQKNVYASLLFMKDVRFDTPLPWTDQPLYEWFARIVRLVRIRTDITYDSCNTREDTLNLLGTRVADSSIPSYVEILVHEARHIDGGGHTCGIGQLDARIDELRSFGVQYYLMLWLGTHWPAATPGERDYALNRAAWLRAGAFCMECQ